MFWSLLLSCLPLTFAGIPGPIDLSHSYDNTTLFWVNSTPFRFTKVAIEETADFWYSANEFETAEHGGTHLDAPYHFCAKCWQVGDIPVERLIGKAVYMDLRAKANNDPDYLVVAEDFEEWEKHHGLMPQGSIILLDFGWTDKYNDVNTYFGTEDMNDTASFHFPGLSEEGAKWLVETGNVFGVGTDAASIDYGQSKDFMSHKILAEHNIYNLEHVAFPAKQLPFSGYTVIALPMKIRHGTGAPCRVIILP